MEVVVLTSSPEGVVGTPSWNSGKFDMFVRLDGIRISQMICFPISIRFSELIRSNWEKTPVDPTIPP